MKGKKRVAKESIDEYLDKYGPAKTKNDIIRDIERLYKISRTETYIIYIKWRSNFMKSKEELE